jgi:hypothetical protein
MKGRIGPKHGTNNWKVKGGIEPKHGTNNWKVKGGIDSLLMKFSEKNS